MDNLIKIAGGFFSLLSFLAYLKQPYPETATIFFVSLFFWLAISFIEAIQAKSCEHTTIPDQQVYKELDKQHTKVIELEKQLETVKTAMGLKQLGR